VWKATDLVDDAEWTSVLDPAERNEIVTAVTHAKSLGKTRATLSTDDFPLPRLTSRIDEWATTLRDGRGFVLLRGFPTDELTADDVELGYVGFGLKFGTPVSQDAQGTLLGHVRDLGRPRTGPQVRLYSTTQRQDFHTDGADIIGLLCMQRAKRGGESRIASAAAVYNEILTREPLLLETLYQPMCWDRNDEQSAGEAPFFQLPVLHDVNGRPRIFYIGWYIRDAQRHPNVPRLTADQLAAMDLIEAVANDPAFHVAMDFQPGDMQLLNNAVILHAREAYDDHAESQRKRHLLRLWLRAHEFMSVEDALRGGIPTRAEAAGSSTRR
jgi:hypothetical protein